jgi:hypothetical protein
MYYPVGVAGSLAQLMDGMIEEFNKTQNEVYVESIFAGGYMEAMDKAQTAFLAGNPPELAVLDAPNLLTLMDIDAVVPLDEYIAKEGGEAYIANFLEGFMKVDALAEKYADHVLQQGCLSRSRSGSGEGGFHLGRADFILSKADLCR